MRKLHRWLMSVFAVLLLYWAGSGLTLAIWDLTDSSQGWNDGGGPGARPTGNPHDVALPATGIGVAIAAAAQAAHAIAPGAPLDSIALRSTPAGVLGVVAIGGDAPRTLTFDMRNRALLSSQSATPGPGGMPPGPRGRGANIHSAIKNWHRGNIVGTWGIAVAMLTGLIALTLAVSGVWMYFSMWRRRANAGRGAFFWS